MAQTMKINATEKSNEGPFISQHWKDAEWTLVKAYPEPKLARDWLICTSAEFQLSVQKLLKNTHRDSVY